MKKVFKTIWTACCIGVLAVYFVACLTPCIRTSSFSFISLLGLTFPFIFLVAVFCCLTILFTRKGTAALLLIIVFLAGYKNITSSFAMHPANGWHMQKDTGSLRIMTWNVEYFLSFYPLQNPLAKPRRDLYKVIQQYNPDVLCMQEFKQLSGPSYPSFVDELKRIGYGYIYISNDSVVPFLGNIAYTGTAILTKKPLLDSGRVNIRNTYMNENLIYGDVEVGNKRLRIFDGHLASLNLYADTINGPHTNKNIYEKTYDRKHKIEIQFREGELTHEKEVTVIKGAINKSPYPVVYCGDNNSPSTTYTYHYLSTGLQDAFLKKGWGLGGTFYGISPTLRIDVCLPNKQFVVQQCTVPQVKLSDHYPVVADITLKQ